MLKMRPERRVEAGIHAVADHSFNVRRAIGRRQREDRRRRTDADSVQHDGAYRFFAVKKLRPRDHVAVFFIAERIELSGVYSLMSEANLSKIK